MGLTLAYYLQQRGHRVTIYERNSYLGGLACSYDYGEFVWDKFYHVILPQDRHLIELLCDIGLENELRWRNTGIGYYAHGEFYSMGTFREMLKSRLLRWQDKIRMGIAIGYSLAVADPLRLYGVTAEEWLTKVFGRSNYVNFWQPLLRAKFGIYANGIAAIFIWAGLKRLLGARSPSAAKGSTGYVRGGYRQVLSALKKRLESEGGRIHLRSKIRAIGLSSELALQEKHFQGSAGGTSPSQMRAGIGHTNGELCGVDFSVGEEQPQIEWFDKVVFTAPEQFALPLLSRRLKKTVGLDNKNGNPSTKYLGVVCLNVVLRRPLTSFYMLNIAEKRIPLTGVIEMTNLVEPAEETAGLFLVYLPRYMDSESAFLRADDAVVYEELLNEGLKRLFPDLGHGDIVSWHVQKATHVQPLPLVGEPPKSMANKVPPTDGPFVLANSSLLACPALNNDEIVGLAKEIATYL